MPANLSMLVHASVLSAWRVLVSRSPGRAGENELSCGARSTTTGTVTSRYDRHIGRRCCQLAARLPVLKNGGVTGACCTLLGTNSLASRHIFGALYPYSTLWWFGSLHQELFLLICSWRGSIP